MKRGGRRQNGESDRLKDQQAASLQPGDASPERFPVALRAYVPSGRAEGSGSSFRKRDAGPSDWSLVFDTETTTKASQRLRFGSYQVRNSDQLFERGLFYDPNVLKRAEQA